MARYWGMQKNWYELVNLVLLLKQRLVLHVLVQVCMHVTLHCHSTTEDHGRKSWWGLGFDQQNEKECGACDKKGVASATCKQAHAQWLTCMHVSYHRFKALKVLAPSWRCWRSAQTAPRCFNASQPPLCLTAWLDCASPAWSCVDTLIYCCTPIYKPHVRYTASSFWYQTIVGSLW